MAKAKKELKVLVALKHEKNPHHVAGEIIETDDSTAKVLTDKGFFKEATNEEIAKWNKKKSMEKRALEDEVKEAVGKLEE